MKIVSAGKWILLSGFLTLSMCGTAAFAINSGDKATVVGYCILEEHARSLSRVVHEAGDRGYDLYMLGQNSCYDARMHEGVDKITVTFVRKLLETTHKDGRVFEFWKVQDARGQEAYSWAKKPDVEI